MPRLKLKFALGGQIDFNLKPNEKVTIGRAADNDLRIEDLSVSLHHAELDLQGSKYVLRDLRSRLGTTVNEHAIAGQEFQIGDSVCFGEIRGHFEEIRNSPAKTSPWSDAIGMAMIVIPLIGFVLLLQTSILPEYRLARRQYKVSSNPYVVIQECNKQLEMLEARKQEWTQRQQEIEKEILEIRWPEKWIDPGPEPSGWRVVAHLEWKAKEAGYLHYKQMEALAENKCAALKADLAEANSRRIAVEKEKTPLAARLASAQSKVEFRDFLNHIWHSYGAPFFHFLLFLSLPAYFFRFFLRYALIKGWLGRCQILSDLNENNNSAE